ncbi:sigma 54-interacting transcriptional regulator [Clostridium sp. AM58-1XD]|uniref:sigma 54-interacting transcriptional regulator n=1 Tax=Clostridium sp. AM58-1XD TaxID=2292307 RepID=UPI000E48350D|nr:sigma 54-interacting transcriptional regulator [Clostridium sp. AM58-1XD]RGY97259.1 AAA family ATPase [Clostridium sp. AM58-1XD]
MIRTVFYAPYPEILPTIEQVFCERPDHGELQYQIIQDCFNNPLENIQADVVIARGFTAHAMQKLGIPCAELKVSGYDVITAVSRCLQLTPARKIAVVGAFNMVYGAETINSVFPDICLTTYPIVDETMLEETVLKARSEGNTAIVGGYTTVEIAKKYDISAVMIESGPESVNSAIAEAKTAAEISFREKERSNEIANIMNYSFQGIISTDRNGIITFANTYCHTIMRSLKTSLTGRSITDFFPDIPIRNVIQKGQKILSEIYRYGQFELMINCVPIVSEYDNAGCVLTFQNVSQIQEEEGQIRKKLHKSGFTAKYHFSDILHKSAVMNSAISDATDFGYSDSNILIYGETGTGKELFAQSIHNSSPRKGNPFVAINCSALPENLLESELFGYVEGAFTGAAKGGKMGFFEIAHKGTIFLDEIGDISPKLQSRLLRVLQEREIIRLGNDTVIPIDVRVISATNKNLKEEVEKGNFRQDLLYRLDVLELNLPPLRERREDISLLLSRFVQFEHERTGCLLQNISSEAMKLLASYPWPGNIREMKNFCERLSILCHAVSARPEDIRRALPDIDRIQTAAAPKPEANPLNGFPCPGGICTSPGTCQPNHTAAAHAAGDERQVILSTLAMFHNNRTRTAAYLRMDKSTLWRKMKKYDISVN